MSVAAPTRVTPTGLIRGMRAHRIWERNYIFYRRFWKVIFSGVFEPIFYLFSIGIGLRALVGDLVIDGRLVSYTAFVAPALMAASAMNGAIFETTFNIFFKLRFQKTYDGMLTTPLRPIDIAFGELGWALLRGALYSTAFLLIMVLMGLIESWWGVLMVPGAILIGFGFGGVGLAATTFMKSWQDFDLVQMFILPLFLFSATFYPLDIYPEAVQRVVMISPLYHGSEILRSLSLGVIDWSLVGHTAFLLAMGLIGLGIANRRLHKLLMP